MEGRYRPYPFDFVNMAASGGQRLAEQGPRRRVAKQQEPLRLHERDMAPCNGRAGLQVVAGKQGTGAVLAGQSCDIGLL